MKIVTLSFVLEDATTILTLGEAKWFTTQETTTSFDKYPLHGADSCNLS